MNERLCWEEEPFVLRNAHIIHMIQTFHLSEISWAKSILCSQHHLDWRTRRIKIDLRDEHGCWHDQTSARVERRMLPSASIRRRPITSCKCPFPPLPILSESLYTIFNLKGKNFQLWSVWELCNQKCMRFRNDGKPEWASTLKLSMRFKAISTSVCFHTQQTDGCTNIIKKLSDQKLEIIWEKGHAMQWSAIQIVQKHMLQHMWIRMWIVDSHVEAYAYTTCWNP
jgi:hypothetical protein